MERLLDIEVGMDGSITEEFEVICTMTGFRRRFLYVWNDNTFQSVELGVG